MGCQSEEGKETPITKEVGETSGSREPLVWDQARRGIAIANYMAQDRCLARRLVSARSGTSHRWGKVVARGVSEGDLPLTCTLLDSGGPLCSRA